MIKIRLLAPDLFVDGDGKAAAGLCVRRDGQPWRITASVEKIERDNRCRYWFVKVKISFEGEPRGSWIEGWGIPAGGGHLPATTTIDAGDYEEDKDRVVGGVVGIRVHSVVLGLSGGRRMVIQPKNPSMDLRRRFAWLRGLRYFLCFYPAGEHVKVAKLLDASGKVIYTARSQESELVGNMVY